MTQKNNKKRGILYLILAYLLYKLIAFFWRDGKKKYQYGTKISHLINWISIVILIWAFFGISFFSPFKI